MAKKGKYAQVIGNLPAMGIDPSREAAVRQAQEQITAPLVEGETAYQALDMADQLDYAGKAIRRLVDMKKRQTAGRPWAAEYARAYAECRAIRDRIAEWDGAFSLLVEAYQWLMIDQMKVEGVTSMVLANGQPVRWNEEPYARVDDPAALLAWVEADPDLRQRLALNWSVLNSLTKQRLLAGEAEPPGVSAWAKTKVTLGGGDE